MSYVVNKFLQLFSTCRANEFFEVLKINDETRKTRSPKSWFQRKLDEYLCEHKQSYSFFIRSISQNTCNYVGNSCKAANSTQCSLNLMGFNSQIENGTNIYSLNITEPPGCSIRK